MEFQREYGLTTAIRFPIPKVDDTDFAATGDWTPATGDVKISKDGGNFANTSNLPTAIGGTGSRGWTLTLTATEMQASEVVIQIVDAALEHQWLTVTTRLGGQIAANKGIIVGEVDNTDFTATTTALEGLRIGPNTTEETTADHFIGRLILITSGSALGCMSPITDYALANSKELYTFDAIVTAPDDNATYVIL